tara:strand:+ start:290 stop:727 length:438 start_codon:yes stop_codon:yes gene_type:complete
MAEKKNKNKDKDSFLDKLEKLPSKLLNFILEPLKESQKKMMEEAGDPYTDEQLKELKAIDKELYNDYLRDPIGFRIRAKRSGVRKGGLMKKKKKMNIGGLTQSPMQNGLSRKINPTTGLTMNKGGMIDYRKKGMFYGGGMARRGR